MAPGNSVTLVGNCTRDPELRFTSSGQAVATFGLAVNRRWQNRQTNEWEEQVSFFDVTVWQQMAENVAESVTKGTRVVVTGTMSWTRAASGGLGITVPPGTVLEAAMELNGPWQPYPGSGQVDIVPNPALKARFFRLRAQ